MAQSRIPPIMPELPSTAVRAEDWDRRWEGKALHVHGEPSAIVTDALEALEPGTALDLGCGSGRHAVLLAERGWQVTAVDFSDEALRQAREHARTRGVDVNWVHKDLLDYKPPGSFQLVLVAYIHLPPHERRALLQRAGRAVAPGGVFLLVGHDSTNVGTGAPGPTNPTLLYAPWDIISELHGLEVERAERVRRPVELEDGRRVEAIDALVQARRPR
jgi:SAM-dependent methyltransferase